MLQQSKHITIIAKDITESGGGERVGVNLANAFVECGYEVEIVSFYASASAPTYAMDSRIKHSAIRNVTKKPKGIAKLLQKTLHRTLINRKINALLAESKPDIVLANDGWFVPMKKLDSTTYLRLWHLNAPKRLNNRKRQNLAKFDTLIVLSSYELATWQSYHRRVRVIPNFLPYLPHTTFTTHAPLLDSTRLDSSQADMRVVLSVGRLSGEKGFDRLLDIWEMVRQRAPHLQQWRLHIVGSGILHDDLQKLINDKGLGDSACLQGFRADMERVYAEASIYAMCSYFEGFGMALAEACSYGLASVGFDIATGPSDIIKHDKSGYLIRDGDKETFATRLIELMESASKRAEFGKQARVHIEQTFSKRVILPLWQKLFEESCR